MTWRPCAALVFVITAGLSCSANDEGASSGDADGGVAGGEAGAAAGAGGSSGSGGAAAGSGGSAGTGAGASGAGAAGATDGGTGGASADTLTLEVMVGTDSGLGQQFGEALPCYVEEVMAHVNYLYGKLRPGLDVNVVMVRHEVDVDLNGLTLSDDKNALLADWIAWGAAQNVGDDGEPLHFDYKLLLTSTKFGASGWARTGVSICDEGAGSIVHDVGYMGAKVIAHEMGHSFGLVHTGNRNNVMNPIPGTAWSPESATSLSSLLLDGTACMADYVPPPDYSGIPIFSTEQQCQTRFAEPACTKFGAPTQCEKLMCSQNSNSCNWDDSPPLDGTSCGDGKWCMGGECVDAVDDGSAPFAGCGG
jgi:ADAMTS cysteine-rich domain 2/Metallo-peptidase family M12